MGNGLNLYMCVNIYKLNKDHKSSVVPMIDYNRKSFIYLQLATDHRSVGILGIDYNRKNPQAKEFSFLINTKCKVFLNFSY